MILKKKVLVFLLLFVSSILLTACKNDDTYKLAKQIDEYKLSGEGYAETLEMARKGNYDAGCEDCFKGKDAKKESLFAFACSVDFEIAKAVYENGADIDTSNQEFFKTPLLAAIEGNSNNPDIVYWLISEGADINAVSYNKASVFQYLRFWDDNPDTQELITYFKEHCDMEYLKESTEGTLLCSWDDLWDADGEFNFYEH